MDCIFCKIVAGEIPSHKIYEDQDVLAFLDISPVHPGHALVIPKKHFDNLEEIDEASLAKVMNVVKKIGVALKAGLGYEGYNVQLNNDPVAGRIVPHLHFHLIPRLKDDGLRLWPQGKYEPGQAEEVAEKIKKAIK